MHGNLGRGADGVVGVGHEAGVHATSQGVAGRREGGLGSSVVLAHEGEDNHVPNVGLDLIGNEDETSGTANHDLRRRVSGDDLAYIVKFHLVLLTL